MHANKTHTHTLLQALRLHTPFQVSKDRQQCTHPRGITHRTQTQTGDNVDTKETGDALSPPSECDCDTVRVKSGIIRLVRVKSEEKEWENQIGVQYTERSEGVCGWGQVVRVVLQGNWI